jgi:endonuclease/exonuclease/phosphatase family metal-dependent hydrolase
VRVWPLVLVTVGVTLAAQVIRALFPLVVYTFGINRGVTQIMVGAYLLVVFLSPLLTPLFTRFLGMRRTLVLAVGGLAVLRLVAQITPPGNISLIVVTAAAVLALMAVPLVTGYPLGWGIILGLALDAMLNAAFLTWDYLWQRDALSFAVALILSGIVFVALWHERQRTLETRDHNRTLALLIGPFFFLELMFLQNPAYATSLTGFALPISSAVVLLGSALTLWMANVRRYHIPIAFMWVASLLLLNNLTGIPAAIALLVAQGGLGFFLFATLETSVFTRLFRTSVLVAVGNLMFLVLVLLFHALDLVGAPLSIAPPLAGALIAFIILRQPRSVRHQTDAPPLRVRGGGWGEGLERKGVGGIGVIIFPLALLIARLGLSFLQPAQALQIPADGSFRLLDYNLHQGASAYGWIDLEGLADTIEAQAPDVIALQEVTRGQLVNGSTDILSWLSYRLGMPYYFAPATTGYGNALLSRIPVVSWDYGPLPRVEAEPRSYVRVQLDVGEPVNVFVTHLNHQNERNRIPQVERLLAVWDSTPRALIVGDLNALPQSTEIMMIEDAGFISAQDVTGNGELFTFHALVADRRIDWIFGTPDIAFDDFAIPQVTASDHLPLVVTVRVSNE